MRKILVVVDVQKDFYHPNGALYVKGGETLPEKIAKIMPMFNKIICTLDWHPTNHCSFKPNGGLWPNHCIQGTEGASLPNEFIPFLDENHSSLLMKGKIAEIEEYGANPNVLIAKMYCGEEYSDEDEIVFCGISGDYCLKETINKFITTYPQHKDKVKVFLDGTASIDDGSTLNQFIEENGLKIWKL